MVIQLSASEDAIVQTQNITAENVEIEAGKSSSSMHLQGEVEQPGGVQAEGVQTQVVMYSVMEPVADNLHRALELTGKEGYEGDLQIKVVTESQRGDMETGKSTSPNAVHGEQTGLGSPKVMQIHNSMAENVEVEAGKSSSSMHLQGEVEQTGDGVQVDEMQTQLVADSVMEPFVDDILHGIHEQTGKGGHKRELQTVLMTDSRMEHMTVDAGKCTLRNELQTGLGDHRVVQAMVVNDTLMKHDDAAAGESQELKLTKVGGAAVPDVPLKEVDKRQHGGLQADMMTIQNCHKCTGLSKENILLRSTLSLSQKKIGELYVRETEAIKREQDTHEHLSKALQDALCMLENVKTENQSLRATIASKQTPVHASDGESRPTLQSATPMTPQTPARPVYSQRVSKASNASITPTVVAACPLMRTPLPAAFGTATGITQDFDGALGKSFDNIDPSCQVIDLRNSLEQDAHVLPKAISEQVEGTQRTSGSPLAVTQDSIPCFQHPGSEEAAVVVVGIKQRHGVLLENVDQGLDTVVILKSTDAEEQIVKSVMGGSHPIESDDGISDDSGSIQRRRGKKRTFVQVPALSDDDEDFWSLPKRHEKNMTSPPSKRNLCEAFNRCLREEKDTLLEEDGKILAESVLVISNDTHEGASDLNVNSGEEESDLSPGRIASVSMEFGGGITVVELSPERVQMGQTLKSTDQIIQEAGENPEVSRHEEDVDMVDATTFSSHLKRLGKLKEDGGALKQEKRPGIDMMESGENVKGQKFQKAARERKRLASVILADRYPKRTKKARKATVSTESEQVTSHSGAKHKDQRRRATNHYALRQLPVLELAKNCQDEFEVSDSGTDSSFIVLSDDVLSEESESEDYVTEIAGPSRKKMNTYTRTSNITGSDSDSEILLSCLRRSTHNKHNIHANIAEGPEGSGTSTDGQGQEGESSESLSCASSSDLASSSSDDGKVVNLLKPSMDDNEVDDDEEDSLSGFIVPESADSGDGVSGCGEEESDSDSEGNKKFQDTPFRVELIRKRKNLDWQFEADMLAAIQNIPEIPLQAVCALYRQQTEDEKIESEAIYLNQRGFDKFNAPKASRIGSFLTDRDGKLIKSVRDLEAWDTDAFRVCQELAAHHSKQLFAIYTCGEDPLWRKATV